MTPIGRALTDALRAAVPPGADETSLRIAHLEAIAYLNHILILAGVPKETLSKVSAQGRRSGLTEKARLDTIHHSTSLSEPAP